MLLWPGARRAGRHRREKALMSEVKKAKEAETSLGAAQVLKMIAVFASAMVDDSGVAMAPFDGHLLRMRRADDTLDAKNGNTVGSWQLAVGSWQLVSLQSAEDCWGRKSYYRTNQPAA